MAIGSGLYALITLAMLAAASTPSVAAPPPIVLSEDGGWCWYEHPRAIVHGDWLVVGSVANGHSDPARRGDIDALLHNLKTGVTTRVELHDRFEADDHDSPAFLARPDGRLLTLYGKHDDHDRLYYRISEANDPTRWSPVREYNPTPSTRLTYANLFQLPAEGGRIYDFFRGLDNSYKPSYVYSDDQGETWKTGNIIINVPVTERHRPYVRYASNGRDTIHLLYTQGHPRDYDNSLFHVMYRAGWFVSSAGRPLAPLTKGLKRPEQGTLVAKGDADHVLWTTDIELDRQGRPHAVYSVQVGSAGLPRGQGGDDLRFRYARWDGQRWLDFPLAYAGSRLYAGEDDYTGLAALDPQDPQVLYISTNADPVTGKPLDSSADGQRHREIFKGVTADGGAHWTWTPITQSSKVDNLRPIVPRSDGSRSILLWLRGSYRSYTDYSQEVVALIGARGEF
jgi:hypothetical protein